MTQERVDKAKPDLLLLAPGPINRGVELTPEVADGPHSAILDQVTNGLAVRMAVLYLLSGKIRSREGRRVTAARRSLSQRGASPCGRSRSPAGGSSTRARTSTGSATSGSAGAASCRRRRRATRRPRSSSTPAGMIVCPGLIDCPRPPPRAGQRGGRDDRHRRRRRPGRRRDVGRLHAQHDPGHRHPGGGRVRRPPGPARAQGQRLSRRRRQQGAQGGGAGRARPARRRRRGRVHRRRRTGRLGLADAPGARVRQDVRPRRSCSTARSPS